MGVLEHSGGACPGSGRGVVREKIHGEEDAGEARTRLLSLLLLEVCGGRSLPRGDVMDGHSCPTAT